MINEVDKALKAVITVATGAPEDLRVDYNPPTKEWASKLGDTPTINFCLYDVREDTTRKRVGRNPVRDERNRIVAYYPPPRWYKLSYIVTAWKGEVEESHELIGWVLSTFAGIDMLPASVLTGSLRDSKTPIQIVVAQPAADTRPTPQSLTALSGEVRPTLDLVVTVPVEFQPTPAAGLVLEPLILDAEGPQGHPQERVQRAPGRAGLRELERVPAGRPLVEKNRAALEAGDSGE